MANKAVEILLKAKDLASNKIAKLNQRVKSIGQTSTTAAEGTDTLSRSTGGLTGRIVTFIGATAGFVTVKRLFDRVISTGSNFETLKTQLDAVTGSAQAGEQAFAWIKDFTKETPLQLEEVSESFVKLKAFGLDPMDGTMQSLVDQSSKLGGGQEKLNGIILAVGQAWAKQKLQAEETLQLVERGVPVYDLLGKALGKTAAEIQEMSANGELGRDAIKALIDEMGSSSLGAAAAQMEDASGIVSNLKDQITEFFAEISDQGVLNYFKSQLKDVASTLKGMAADGSLKELARDIADFMIKGAEYTKSFITTIVRFSGELKTLAIVMAAVKFGAFLRNLRLVGPAAISAAASIKTLSAALIATGWGAVALGIGLVVSKLIELKNINIETEQLQRRTAETVKATEKIWSDLSDRLGIMIKGEDDLKKAREEGLIVFDKQTNQYELATEKTKELTRANDAYKALLDNFNAELANNAEKTMQSIDAGELFRQKLEAAQAATGGLSESLRQMSDQDFADFVKGATDFGTSPFASDLEKADVKAAVLAASLQRLNIDTELLKSGMTSAGLATVTAFENIADEAGSSARLIKQSLSNALDTVSTQAGFDRLSQKVKQLGKDGKLTAKEVKDGLNDIENAAKQANSALNDMNSALSAANDLDALNSLSFEFASQMQQGAISAQEYLDLIKELDEKRANILETTERQRKEDENINDQLKERQGILDKQTEEQQKQTKQQEQQNAAAEQGNQTRSVTIQQTERQAVAMQKATEALKDQADQVNSTSSYFKYLDDVESLAQQYEQASENAGKLADSIIDVAQSGKASAREMQGYVRSLESAIAKGDDLDGQTLSKLQSALSAAKSKMEALKNETKSAAGEVLGLESELASLNGNQAQVQRLEYQQKRLDLEEKIANARLEGNTDAERSYKKALTLLERINAKKQTVIREEQQAATQAQTTQPAPAAGDKMTLEFKDKNGQTVEGEFKRNDAHKVMDILKTAGARTV